MIVTTVGCARCWGDGHSELLFNELTHPIEDSNGNFTHWALCPTTNEPILMRVVPESGNSENG